MAEVNLNEEMLADVAIVANTPTFLFERFRRDSSVQAIAQKLPASEIASRASSYGSSPERSFLDKVRAYAYIVALSFKSASDIHQAFQLHPLPPFEWASALADLAITNAPAGTSKVVVATPMPTLSRKAMSTSSMNIESVVHTPSPAILSKASINLSNQRKVINLD